MCLKYPHCKHNGVISHLQKQAKGLHKLLNMARHNTHKKAVFLDGMTTGALAPCILPTLKPPHSEMRIPC